MKREKNFAAVVFFALLVLFVAPVEAKATSDVGHEIAMYATSDEFLGLPYVWGGESMSGFDCSGFVRYVFREFGYELPRTTYDQVLEGTEVSFEDLEEGDLVFFYSDVGHVGIYIGEGQFVHASSSGIRISGFNSADEGDYYMTNYNCARRIVE